MMKIDNFNIQLKKQESPLCFSFDGASKRLFIAFGGVRGKTGIAPFEFFNLTSSFPSKKIYVRDHRASWYHKGLPGIGDDIEDIRRFLQETIAGEQVDHVVMTGNSMGGYAALLFGCLLGVKQVHAFAPQTFIDYQNMRRTLDWRFWYYLRQVHKAPDRMEQYFDLRNVIDSQSTQTTYHIYYSERSYFDKLHAHWLQDLPRVHLHPYKVGGHLLVKHLRSTGQLRTILTDSLEH